MTQYLVQRIPRGDAKGTIDRHDARPRIRHHDAFTSGIEHSFGYATMVELRQKARNAEKIVPGH